VVNINSDKSANLKYACYNDWLQWQTTYSPFQSLVERSIPLLMMQIGMYVCMYIYICMYTYIYIYIYIWFSWSQLFFISFHSLSLYCQPYMQPIYWVLYGFPLGNGLLSEAQRL